ncbi:peptide-methionine (R)-S-oxide reductase MsrB [Pseudophaeobacter flagellatus]|uniref:peptide-methionine (R)-S-oxide reductase MsrB n=1 Tax=Pseudophaeobacter flagellatus TaxID=2899119 RepID=UPI001E3DA356|nr:peptide-methionine (R)-S-oxide reductase MsrB [Pseudophaeobacter flagellatus]MCD9146243.1 peptide-methionine (R)-S-oxide reductase MsrB [Pseudophaeobacter flagellatus]
MNRRTLLTGIIAFAGTRLHAQEGPFEITRTQVEWRAMLTNAEYAVMREEETEPPYSSPLLTLTRAGTYHCKGCDLPVYSSQHKYDSETGWPSFWKSLPGAVRTKPDNSLFATRTEVHCRRCGSHLGHIFDDGPAPTGKRHCLNGVSLTFKT